MIMKQTVEEAAKECRRTTAQSMSVYAQYHSIDECPNHGITYDEIAEAAFIKGAEWQSKQSPWINVEERLPEENENIIIMCEHGAIFNGSYCNGVWFCMDGYIYDTYKNSPIYSSEFVKLQHKKGITECGILYPDVVSWSVELADTLIEKLRGK